MMSDYGERRAHNVLRNEDHLRHAIPQRSLPRKVQVKLVLQYPLREVPHAEQRYFMALPKRRRSRK